jgi:hypothetical protein
MPATNVVFYSELHGSVPALAILAGALTKKQQVPPIEIDRAIERKRAYEQDPQRQTSIASLA